MLRPFQNICIFGAGAIGGAIAARLTPLDEHQGLNVSVIARGAHLDAVRQRGLRIHVTGEPEPFVANPRATSNASELGPQDLVFVTLKGHQLPAACDALARLIGPRTRVVLIQNGIPWWYFHADRASGFEGKRLEKLDPGGLLWDRIGPERVIAGIAYQGAQMIAPGEIQLAGMGQFIFGEPSGEITDDLTRVVQLIGDAGWRVAISQRIRDEIWAKLQGNAAFNPLSALSRATMSDLLQPPLIHVARKIMAEVQAVAEALGARILGSAEERITSAGGVGAVKTSMLQDVELGRRLEYIPICLAVSELGRIASVETPINDTVLALIEQLDRSLEGPVERSPLAVRKSGKGA